MNNKIFRISIILSLVAFQSTAQITSKDIFVGTTFTIASTIMQEEREVQVYLPEGYADTEVRYPVLYVLDGQRYFLHAVSFQQSFLNFKQTPPYIIVGISKKKADRNRYYSVNAPTYLKFLEEEVIDLVDKRFRTSNKRILFGWAYAGGFALETMIKAPDLFDSYIAASPFPVKDKIIHLDSIFTQHPNFDKLLYFTSETNEGRVKEETKALHNFLANKAAKTMDWTFKELRDEEHRSTPFTTLYHGIKQCFAYYPELQFNSLTDFLEVGGLEYVYQYYRERAKRHGFAEELSDWTMFSITRNAMRADDYQAFEQLIEAFKPTLFLERLRISRSASIAEFYLKNKQYEAAINLFQLLEEKHPTAKRSLNGLVEAYTQLGQPKEAKKYLEKIERLSESN